ncbi:hypothetical protein BH24ACT5_BH24ACT5_21990 [soil metagenome]
MLFFSLDNVLAEPDDPDPPCPSITSEEVAFFTQARGWVTNASTYEVDAFYDDSVGDGLPGVNCGPDLIALVDNPDSARPFAVVVEAASLSETATFDQYVASVETSQILAEDVPDIGGRIAGWCRGASSQRVCVMSWSRSHLLITVALLGPVAAVEIQVAQTLLVEMVPTIVANLIAYEPGGAPADPDGGVPPVTADGAPTLVTAAPPPTTAIVTTTTTAAVPTTTAVVPTTVFSKSLAG